MIVLDVGPGFYFSTSILIFNTYVWGKGGLGGRIRYIYLLIFVP